MVATGAVIAKFTYDDRVSWAKERIFGALTDLGLGEGETASNESTELAPEGPKREEQLDKDRQRLIERGWTVQPDGTLKQPESGPDSAKGR